MSYVHAYDRLFVLGMIDTLSSHKAYELCGGCLGLMNILDD